MAADAVTVDTYPVFHASAVATWAVAFLAFGQGHDALSVVALLAEFARAFGTFACRLLADPVVAETKHTCRTGGIFACILGEMCPRNLVMNGLIWFSRGIPRAGEHAFADAHALLERIDIASNRVLGVLGYNPAVVRAFQMVAAFERESVACVGATRFSFLNGVPMAFAVFFDAYPCAVFDVACEAFQARDIASRAALDAVFRHIRAERVGRAVVLASIFIHAAPEAVTTSPIRDIRELDGGFSAHAVVVRA